MYAAYSWIRNVETERVDGVHVALVGAYRFVLRDSYAHHSRKYAYGGGSYGYSLEWQASDNLVENNIVYYMNKPIQFRSSGGGNVVAYNYVDDSWSQPDMMGKFWFQELSIDSHCSFPHMELVEGNYAPHMGVAATWGNAGYLTYFRNHASSQFRTITTPYGNVEAIQLDARVLATNVVGNVLGKPGLAGARYETATCGDVRRPGALHLPLELRLRARLLQVPGGLGFTGHRHPPSPRQLRPRDGPGPVGWEESVRSLPASLYLSEKPAFFGSAPWPWVDPLGPIEGPRASCQEAVRVPHAGEAHAGGREEAAAMSRHACRGAQVKHVLISVIVAVIVLPVIAARDPNPRRGATRMVLYLLAFHLLYVGWLTLVHANYVLPPTP